MSSSEKLNIRSLVTPNRGMFHSAQNALNIGLINGLITGLIVGLSVGLITELTTAALPHHSYLK
jgi:hypothetical protein